MVDHVIYLLSSKIRLLRNLIFAKGTSIKAVLIYQFRELKLKIVQLSTWKVSKLIIIHIYTGKVGKGGGG